ncbi:hypothetical protein Esti_000337 [Eimeria stiedai]
MLAEEDHIEAHEGSPTNEAGGGTYASYRQTNNPFHLSAPSQSRRIHRSGTSYPHLPRSLSNSLASRCSFQIGSSRQFECSEGRSSFLTGLSARLSSEDSFWGCSSPKSEEYVSACSGPPACSASSSQELRRGPRGAAGPQLTQLYLGAFGEALSEVNVRSSLLEPFTGEEVQRQLSAPGLLLTAVPFHPCSSLPATGSQLGAQPHALHSNRAFPEQAAAAALCGLPHAQLGEVHLSVPFLGGPGACEPAQELRATSDQLDYKGSLQGSCCGDHPVEEGQHAYVARRQMSSPSRFIHPLRPQPLAADPLQARANDVPLSEEARGNSLLLVSPFIPSPDSSGNAILAAALGSSKAFDGALSRTSYSRLTVNHQHSPGGQDSTRGRAEEGEAVTSTLAGRRSSSWVAPFRKPSFSHPREPTPSAECLATEVSVGHQSKGVADPIAAARDAVETSSFLTTQCPVSRAFSRSAFRSECNSWKTATNLAGAAVCRVSSSREGTCRRKSCSSARRSQSMSGPGASIGSSSRSSSDCSSSSDNSRTGRSCSGSSSCSDSVSSSGRSRGCSSVRSGVESNCSNSSCSLSTDSRFCSPMEVAEIDSASLQDEDQPGDADSHSDASVSKHWSPCYEDVSNGEGESGDMGADHEHACEGGVSEQASGVSCMAESNADAHENSVAATSLPCIHFGIIEEGPIQPSHVANEVPISATATASRYEVEAHVCLSHEDTCGDPTVTTLDVQDIKLSAEPVAAGSVTDSNTLEGGKAILTASVEGVSVTSAGCLENTFKDTSLGDGHDLESLPASAAAGKGPLSEASDALSGAASASFIGKGNEFSRDSLETSHPECQMTLAAVEELSDRARHSKTKRGSLAAFFDTKGKRKKRSSSHAALQLLTNPDSEWTISEALANRSASENLLVPSEASSQLSLLMESGPLDTSGEPLQAQRGCISAANQPESEEAVPAVLGVMATQEKSFSFPSRKSPSHVSCIKLRRRHSGGCDRRASRGYSLSALELNERFPLSHEKASREALLDCLKLHECIPLELPVTRRMPSIAYSLELTEDEEDDGMFEEEGGYSTGLSGNKRPQEQRKAPLREASSPPFGSSPLPRHRDLFGVVRRRASCADVNDWENSRRSRQFSLPEMPRARSRLPVHAHGSSGNQVLQNADIQSADSRVKSEHTPLDVETARLASFDEEAGPEQQDTRGFSKGSAMTETVPSATSPEFGQESSQAFSRVQANVPPIDQNDSEGDVSADESEDSGGSDNTTHSLKTAQTSFLDGPHDSHGPFVPPDDNLDSWVSQDDNLNPVAEQTAGDDPTGPQELRDTCNPNAHRGFEGAAQDADTTQFPQAEPQEVFQESCILLPADRGIVEKMIRGMGEKHADSVESTNAQQWFHHSALDLPEPQSCGPPPALKDAAFGVMGGKPDEDQTACDVLGCDSPPSQRDSSFRCGAAESPRFQSGEAFNGDGVHTGILGLQVVLKTLPKRREPKKTVSSSSVLPSVTSSIYGGSNGAEECLTDEHRASRRMGTGERVRSEPAISPACSMSSELQYEGRPCSSRRRSDGDAGSTPGEAEADSLCGLSEPVSVVQMSTAGGSGLLLTPSSALAKADFEATREGQGLPSCMEQLSLHERVHYLPSDDPRQSSSSRDPPQLRRASATGRLGSSLKSSSQSSGQEVLEEQSRLQGSSVPASPAVRGPLAPPAEGIAEDIAAVQDLSEDLPPTTKCFSEPAIQLSFDGVSAQRNFFGESTLLASAMAQVGGFKTPLFRHGSKPRTSRSVSFSGLPVFKSFPAHNKPREIRREWGGRQIMQTSPCNREIVGAGHVGSVISEKRDDYEACIEGHNSEEEGSADDRVVHSNSSHRQLPVVNSCDGNSSSDGRQSSGSESRSSHGEASNIGREPTFHDALSSEYFDSRNSSMNHDNFCTAANSLSSGIAAAAEEDEGLYEASSLISASSKQTLPGGTVGTHVTDPKTFPSDEAEERRPSTDAALLGNSAAAGAPWFKEVSSSAPADDSSALLAGASRETGSIHLTAEHSAESTADHAEGGLGPARPSRFAAALSSLAQMILAKPPDGQCEDDSQQQTAPEGVTQTDSVASPEAQQHSPLREPSSKTEAACQGIRATSEEFEAEEELQGDSLKESKKQEHHQPDVARPGTDVGALPLLSVGSGELHMGVDHDVSQDSSGQLIRDPAPPWKNSLADVQAVRFTQLPNEAAQRRQQLAAEHQLKPESFASALLACGESRRQSEGSSRSSSSESAPRSTDSSEPETVRSSSVHPSDEVSRSADEAADDLKSPDAGASPCATETQGSQVSCLMSTDTSESAARLLLESMRPRGDDLSKSLIAEITQSSAEDKGDHLKSLGSRHALVAGSGKNEVELRRLGEVASALQCSEEHPPNPENLRTSFVSDASVVRKPAALQQGFQQSQEECESKDSHHQRKRAEPSDSALKRAWSGHEQFAPSPLKSLTVPAGRARQSSGDASMPFSNVSTRRGFVEANRVFDGTVAHVLRTPRLMRGPQDAGPVEERAELGLLVGEAEKWEPPELTTAAPPAIGGGGCDALEKSLSCASKAAVARRLAQQQPALTCSMPPIFCNPCLSDSSLWNLQLRRQYSPNSNLASIPRPEHAPQEDGFRLSASARKGWADQCGHAPSEAASSSAGLKREQHERKLASRKSSGSLVKEVVFAPALPPSLKSQDLFEKEVGQAFIRQPRAAVRSPGRAVSRTMAKPRRPWACGEAPSVSSEEPKPYVRTYVHKPGCRCPLCLSPGCGVPGSPRITDISTPRLANGLPVVPVQPAGYAAATPMRIVSSPIGPQLFHRFGGGGTTPFESSGDATYDAHAGALTARSYYDAKPSSICPLSTAQHTYSPPQFRSPPVQMFGSSDWHPAGYQRGTPKMNIIPTDYPVVSGEHQLQGDDQPYGTPSFAVSPASRTRVSEGMKSNAASSPIPSRGVSYDEAEKNRLQQEYKEQQEEVRRRQEELEKQRARQQEEIEVEKQLLKEQRERLEKQREEFEREKQEILQARLQATPRGKDNGREQGAGGTFVNGDSLISGKGETDSFNVEAQRRQHGPPQRHTASTFNIIRSITRSGLGGVQSASRLGSAAAEEDAVEDKEAWNAGSARHQQQSGGASRFFSRAASIDTMDDKETSTGCEKAFLTEHLCVLPTLLIATRVLNVASNNILVVFGIGGRWCLVGVSLLVRSLSAALDKVAQIRMKLDTLQQQLEMQSHEVASYYNSLKAAEQVHGSLQQTAADCRVCFGRRNTQLQEVDKRLSVLTAQDLHPCSLEELEELAQELEGTQYKLTVVQAQRSGGAVEDNRKNPKQLLPYSSSCLPEPKSSFAIPEEPVSRIGPDECVAMQESVLQEIQVLAEDLDHIKSVHLQFKKAYKRLQGLMTQEVNSYDVDLQRLVAIEKNLEDKLRRLLFLNGDANYSELSDSQMQEYFRTVNQSIRKVYREIALRESGDRRHEARSSGTPRKFSRGRTRTVDGKHDDEDNLIREFNLRREDSTNCAALPQSNTMDSHLAVQFRQAANLSGSNIQCSSVHPHPPFVASSKARSIAAQHMLMPHGRCLPRQMTDERAAHRKAPHGVPMQSLSNVSSIFESPINSASTLTDVYTAPLASLSSRRLSRQNLKKFVSAASVT